MIATVVDFAALWKILLCALAVGVGLTAVFGAGAAALARFTEARGEGANGAVAANGAIVAAAGLVCALALVAGFVAITHK